MYLQAARSARCPGRRTGCSAHRIGPTRNPQASTPRPFGNPIPDPAGAPASHSVPRECGFPCVPHETLFQRPRAVRSFHFNHSLICNQPNVAAHRSIRSQAGRDKRSTTVEGPIAGSGLRLIMIRLTQDSPLPGKYLPQVKPWNTPGRRPIRSRLPTPSGAFSGALCGS
jgi:hypothetical protein